MSYTDKAEVTREHYRKQGERRERERIMKLLSDLSRTLDNNPVALDLVVNLELLISVARIERGQAANHDLPS